jgi:conjugal transfer pilus assembly protein TraB
MDPNAPMQPVVKRAFTLEVSNSTVAAPAAPQAQPQAAGMSSAPDKEEKTSAENYLPAGTFMRVVLLAGLDADGGQAQSNPHPILMRVLDQPGAQSLHGGMKDCVIRPMATATYLLSVHISGRIACRASTRKAGRSTYRLKGM